MLTRLHEALHDHFAALSLPVWQADCVPDGTAFPYLTLRIMSAGEFGSSGEVCVTCWLRSHTSHADRLATADAILAAIPSNGLLLKTADGLATLYRKDRESIRFGEDHHTQYAELSFDLRTYPNP